MHIACIHIRTRIMGARGLLWLFQRRFSYIRDIWSNYGVRLETPTLHFIRTGFFSFSHYINVVWEGLVFDGGINLSQPTIPKGAADRISRSLDFQSNTLTPKRGANPICTSTVTHFNYAFSSNSAQIYPYLNKYIKRIIKILILIPWCSL